MVIFVQPSKLPPPPKPVFINFVVLSTTLFITVALILTFARAWRKRSLKNTASQERFSFFNPNTTNIPPPRKILPFFQRLAPLELTANITWLQLFRRRLITDHSYCAVFCAAFGNTTNEKDKPLLIYPFTVMQIPSMNSLGATSLGTNPTRAVGSIAKVYRFMSTV